MRNILAGLGWLLAVVAAGYAALLTVEKQNLNIEHELALAKLQKTEARMAEQVEKAQAEIDALKEGIAEARKARASAEEAAAQASPEADSAEDSGEDSGAEEESSQESQGKRMMRAQMSALMDMAYGGFFEEAALSPETEEAVRALLVDYAVDSQSLQIKAFREGNRPAKEVHAEEEAVTDALRAKLKPLLTAEEMDLWNDYEADSDRHLFETVLDGQLSMLASGLSAENKQVVKEVMAEELAFSIDEYQQSSEILSMGSFNRAQSRALQASMERLAEVLDEEQLGYAQGFVDRAEEMFETMGE